MISELILNVKTGKLRRRKLVEIQTKELWPGHKCTCFVVRRWFDIFKYFNLVFARAKWKHEFMIDNRWHWDE